MSLANQINQLGYGDQLDPDQLAKAEAEQAVAAQTSSRYGDAGGLGGNPLANSFRTLPDGRRIWNRDAMGYNNRREHAAANPEMYGDHGRQGAIYAAGGTGGASDADLGAEYDRLGRIDNPRPERVRQRIGPGSPNNTVMGPDGQYQPPPDGGGMGVLPQPENMEHPGFGDMSFLGGSRAAPPGMGQRQPEWGPNGPAYGGPYGNNSGDMRQGWGYGRGMDDFQRNVQQGYPQPPQQGGFGSQMGGMMGGMGYGSPYGYPQQGGGKGGGGGGSFGMPQQYGGGGYGTPSGGKGGQMNRYGPQPSFGGRGGYSSGKGGGGY